MVTRRSDRWPGFVRRRTLAIAPDCRCWRSSEGGDLCGSERGVDVLSRYSKQKARKN